MVRLLKGGGEQAVGEAVGEVHPLQQVFQLRVARINTPSVVVVKVVQRLSSCVEKNRPDLYIGCNARLDGEPV